MAAGKIICCHCNGVAARREYRGFVHEVRQIGAAEPGGKRGDLVERHVLREYYFFDVNEQYCDSARLVGAIDQYLSIEAACPQQRRVEYLRPVGRREKYDALLRVETVEFAE